MAEPWRIGAETSGNDDARKAVAARTKAGPREEVAGEILLSMSELVRMVRRASREDMAALGVAPEQGRFLRILEREGGSARPSVLADRLHVTARSVTSKVDSAEQAGFVRREPDPTDRRAAIVSLTDAGRAALAESEASRERHAAELLEGIPDEDCRVLARQLRALVSGARNAGSGPTNGPAS